MECVPIGDCGAHAWCDQDKYTAYCAAHSAAASQCPSVFCKEEAKPEPEPEAEPEAEPEPEPEHEPETASSTVQPSSTSVPVADTTSPESACLPTNYAYRLYCAAQSASGECPSPWCERGVAALQASKARREAGSRRHSFLGTLLIQEAASLGRQVVPVTEGQSHQEL